MYYYRATCAFSADWDNLFPSLFGTSQHSYSRIGEDGPNVAVYGFTSPQTPANLGPLVVVEIIPSP